MTGKGKIPDHPGIKSLNSRQIDVPTTELIYLLEPRKLKWESAMVAILLSCMDASYCTPNQARREISLNLCYLSCMDLNYAHMKVIVW